ncbi:MAG TPA: hypothetical protein VLH79_05595 [Chthonomonadales bacterium]|nr:hypothetical protein [Chthonomonadales bacterium]
MLAVVRRLAPSAAVALALAFALLPTRGDAEALIQYRLAPRPATTETEASTHVTMRFTAPADGAPVRLLMPAWTPGDYRIRHHGRNVRSLSVQDASAAPLPTERLDDSTWEVRAPAGAPVTVRYTLPNSPPDIFTDHVRVSRRYAFYSGHAVFLYVDGRRAEPVELEVRPPAGWRGTTTSLDPAMGPDGQPEENRFTARTYDELADSPLLVGESVQRDFTVAGRLHRVAFFNRHRDVRPEAVMPAIRAIVESQVRWAGGAPYTRFVFFIDVGGTGGALEHYSSTRIAWNPAHGNLPLLALVSHEFFHVWNVKRLRPRHFDPMDLQRTVDTRDLWFIEGVTEYYTRRFLLHAGVFDASAFLESMAFGIDQLRSTPARLRVTAEESGRRVWEANNSEGFGGLSYYLKGKVVGLCLDLYLRHVAPGSNGLDDVIRDLLARYGAPRPGYPEGAIRAAVVRLGGAAAGELLDTMTRTTQELPVGEVLAAAGLRARPARGGTVIEEDPEASEAARAIGAAWLRPSYWEADAATSRRQRVSLSVAGTLSAPAASWARTASTAPNAETRSPRRSGPVVKGPVAVAVCAVTCAPGPGQPSSAMPPPRGGPWPNT